MSGRHSTGQRVAEIEAALSPEFRMLYLVGGHDSAPNYSHTTKSLTHAHELAEMVELANKEEREQSNA